MRCGSTERFLDAFFAFFAALFSFCVKTACFLPSLLFLCSLLMMLAPDSALQGTELSCRNGLTQFGGGMPVSQTAEEGSFAGR